MDKPWKLYKILQRAPKSPFRGPFTPADHSYNNNQNIKDPDKKASERLKGHLKFNYEYFYGICQAESKGILLCAAECLARIYL